MRFLGNTRSLVVHNDGCECIEHMDHSDMWWFEELYQAVGHGFRECGACIGSEQMEWYRMLKEQDREIRTKHFHTCLVCSETRGVQKAHITPRRWGGTAMMPLCPRCHWNYDHYLLHENEFQKVLTFIRAKKDDDYAEYVERNYRNRHWERMDKRDDWVTVS